MKLVADERAHGSYRWGEYKSDTIYTFYQYKEISAVYSGSSGSLSCTDQLVERMCWDGFVSSEETSAYMESLHEYFSLIDAHDDLYIEKIYNEICLLRRAFFGENVLKGSGCDRGFNESKDFIERMHKDGEIIWANAIVYNYQEVLSAGHNDDISMYEDPEKGWGWLADRGFDLIQTDFVYQCRVFLEETNRWRR